MTITEHTFSTVAGSNEVIDPLLAYSLPLMVVKVDKIYDIVLTDPVNLQVKYDVTGKLIFDPTIPMVGGEKVNVVIKQP